MTESNNDETTPAGKGHATPTRKEREAANKRPLVSADRKAARKAQAARNAAERAKVRAGMEAGDEKYLPLRDKGPQRRYVRDFVDARWTAGEFMVPAMIPVVIVSLFPNFNDAAFQLSILVAIYGLFLLAILDGLIIGRQVFKRLEAKYGAGNVEKGVKWYAAMRAFQFRPLRLPKIAVKRGEFPV